MSETNLKLLKTFDDLKDDKGFPINYNVGMLLEVHAVDRSNGTVFVETDFNKFLNEDLFKSTDGDLEVEDV